MQKLVCSIEAFISRPWLASRDDVILAREGMVVFKNPDFPKGEESGRVCDGPGKILCVSTVVGGLDVHWIDRDDRTIWTRAGIGGFDVVSTT